MSKPSEEPKPGQGIRSMNSSNLFRITNFELFVKPVNPIQFLYYCKCLTIYF